VRRTHRRCAGHFSAAIHVLDRAFFDLALTARAFTGEFENNQCQARPTIFTESCRLSPLNVHPCSVERTDEQLQCIRIKAFIAVAKLRPAARNFGPGEWNSPEMPPFLNKIPRFCVLSRVPTMPDRSLEGLVILIFQRGWVIARSLANALEAEGARVLLSATVPEHPQPSAAILDSHRPELCQQLKANGVPFLLYTGNQWVHDECAGALIVRKPASPADVVEAVKRLLT
jgi:hypothetical protein